MQIFLIDQFYHHDQKYICWFHVLIGVIEHIIDARK